MLLNAATVAWINWELKPEINWWWISIVLFLLTIFFVLSLLSGKTLINTPMPKLVGGQFLITAVIIILNSFVVKKIQHEFSQTLSELKQKK
jgi:amino acid transporter